MKDKLTRFRVEDLPTSKRFYLFVVAVSSRNRYLISCDICWLTLKHRPLCNKLSQKTRYTSITAYFITRSGTMAKVPSVDDYDYIQLIIHDIHSTPKGRMVARRRMPGIIKHGLGIYGGEFLTAKWFNFYHILSLLNSGPLLTWPTVLYCRGQFFILRIRSRNPITFVGMTN